MTSMTIHLMTILSILIAPLSAYGSAIRHSGRSHPHPKVQAHQEAEGNGSGVGLYELVPPPIVPEPVSSSTHTPDVTFQDSILPVNIPMSTGMEDQPTPTNIPTISHYAFPTTVIQIAVASNCPDTPSSSAIFPLLSTDLASYNATNTMETSSPTITNYVPVYVNATAFLPNGSSTVFLSLSSPTATTTLEPTELPSADTARIVQDSNGCQTVYTAATITVCSTTIRPPGMLAVPVTDCDQWITFSSQKLGGDCSSTDYTVLQTVKSPTLGPLAGPLSPSPTPSPRITGPVVFYAAHWYELVEHPVPRLVRVENCLHDMGISSICQTSSEAWNVVYNTRIITTSSVASFSGVSRRSHFLWCLYSCSPKRNMTNITDSPQS